MCCSASNCLHVFYCSFCCWFLVLMHCGQIEWMGLFLFSYICWGLLCALRYDQFWRRFHELLRRMYIMQRLCEIFCRHQLGPFGLLCDLVLEFLYWFFVWMTYLLVIGLIKVSHYHCVGVIYVFRSFRISLMKLGALTLSAYRFIRVISLWYISSFISVECPSLSCLINVKFEVYFIWDRYCYPCLFTGTTGLVGLLSAFPSQPVLVSVNEVGLL
jgi:hypothetical protein